MNFYVFFNGRIGSLGIDGEAGGGKEVRSEM